jgi:hypothetical protein
MINKDEGKLKKPIVAIWNTGNAITKHSVEKDGWHW